METFFGGGVSPLAGLGVVLGSYFLGCFSTGYYLVRQRTGQDIRELGSGSTGARNAGRVLGRPGFWWTMAGDLAKGGIAVGLALALTGSERVELLAWLAVVAGHIWPAQLGFRGGKGVSTSLMGLLVFDWRLALIYCVFFAAGWAVTRQIGGGEFGGVCAVAGGRFLAGRGPGGNLGNFGSCGVGHPGASSERGGRDGGAMVPARGRAATRSICQRIMSTSALQFKIATEEWEFEQIHELNYRTFVEEIPQHQPAEQPRLVDKFHEENTYLICLAGEPGGGDAGGARAAALFAGSEAAEFGFVFAARPAALRGALAGGGEGVSQQPGFPGDYRADVAVWDGARV